MPSTLTDRVSHAIEAGAEELLRRQRPDGAFTDTPPSSVLGTAGAITALHAADPHGSVGLIDAGAAWLRQAQQPDGGWGGVVGAASELVATAIATSALAITSAVSGAEVEAGRQRLAALGGVSAINDRAVAHMCQQFLALAELPEAGRLRRLPLEVVLVDGLRRRRISFRTSPFIGLALMQLQSRPVGAVRSIFASRAQATALRLLEDIHEHEGRTGAFSEDPWPAALVCLGLARAGLAPHLVTAITSFLRGAVRADGSWDAVSNLDLTRSAFAATGLVAAGYTPRLTRTRELFHRCQQEEPFTVFGTPAGGWSYSGRHGWPVTLESAEILTALAGFPDRTEDIALRRGIAWLVQRQDSRGSWSLWVRNTRLPNDGPCPAITSQGVVALVETGHDVQSGPVSAAVRWLLTQQRADGTFANLWYRDFTSGTSMVLDALARAGQSNHPVARRAYDWLLATQHPDGSWGPGDGRVGSVEETSWAAHAVLAAGADPGQEALTRAITWLLDAQQPDGGWPPSHVCVYIRHFMHYPNGAITRGLALRTLASYRDAVRSSTGAPR